MAASSSPEATRPYRVLVVTTEAATGRPLVDEIARHTRGRQTELRLVTPATPSSPLKLAAGEVDPAIEEARGRLEESVRALRQTGAEVTGHVGDADPVLALEDELAMFPADEVMVVTHPDDSASWLEKDAVERARQEVDRPITHVVVEPDHGSGAKLEKVERVEPDLAAQAAAGSDADRPDYLPPMVARDKLALLVGLLGTIALGGLALACGIDQNWQSLSGGCAARVLIAIAAFMVTVWHGVALLLMGAVRYRGFWTAATAYSLIGGIPVALLVSLIVG
jgi:hypothetical protein